MGIKKQKEHKTSYCIWLVLTISFAAFILVKTPIGHLMKLLLKIMFNLLAKGLLKLIWKFFLQILKWIIEKSVHEMLEHCIFRNFKKDSNT
ncbi:hypothetical protein INP51_12300 [Blautia liquoris]|uniref:Uncharacterized protein n=1 Tax=Blautia liquoris TaxID=2779518 RepID=A0A7M2REL2_9FIRM|nr:hypothetical protein [Blautia liquoris]QOV18775.1 hypothetical protein INP51_12300 [Blautia liquoris]